MRLRHAVVKRSLGRVFLHHLRSAYYAEVNDVALEALQKALAAPAEAKSGRPMLDKLLRRGMVEEGPCEPLAERSSSPLVSVEIEPVGRCNLECGHCFAGFSDAVMSEATFKEVLRGADRLGAVEITFNGGEPLLNRSCLDWVEMATAQGLRALLFTNGTLVTAASARRLAAAGLAKATVSLDGFEAEHDALRGLGSWQRAERGIRHFVGAGIAVHVTTMVHPGNQDQLGELHRYCRETLGVSGVRVSTIAAMGRATSRADLQLVDERFKAVYQAEPARQPDAGPGNLPCLAGVNKLYVSARGEVHGCHLFDGVAPSLGDLHQESLEGIYSTISQRESGMMLRAFDQRDLRGCAGCPAMAKCAGGCRARAWTLTGDRHGVDPVSCRKYGLLTPKPQAAAAWA